MRRLLSALIVLALTLVWTASAALGGNQTEKILAEIKRIEDKCNDEYFEAADNMLELNAKKAKSWAIFRKGIQKKIDKIYRDAAAKFDNCMARVERYKDFYSKNRKALKKREQFYDGCQRAREFCVEECVDDDRNDEVGEIDSCEDKCEKESRRCFTRIDRNFPLQP